MSENSLLNISEAIIVEGKYDKIKLNSIVNSVIIETNGFSIFTDTEKLSLLSRLSKTCGVIIFTDSDFAGIKIRNFLKEYLKDGIVLHAFIPEIKGKEKRKTASSAEGLLGIEGVSKEIIVEALTLACKLNTTKNEASITIYHLYTDGLTGKADSKIKRQKLLSSLGLPTKLSTNTLLSVLNAFLSLEEYGDLVGKL